MFIDLVEPFSIIWLKHPQRLNTSITELSWTRSSIRTLIVGYSICPYGMGLAFYTNCTGQPVWNVNFSPMQQCWLQLLHSGTLVSGQIPSHQLQGWTHEHQLERAVCHHHGTSHLGGSVQRQEVSDTLWQCILHSNHDQGFLKEQVYDGSGPLTGHVWHAE